MTRNGLPITSHQVRTGLLEPMLEAQALNDEQAKLIHRPETAAVDSLTEVFRALIAKPSKRLVVTGLLIGQDIAVSNRRERDHVRSATGVADTQLRAVRDLELNGPVDAVLSIRSIVRALREPLRSLLDPAGCSPSELIDAGHTVKDLIRRVDHQVLLGKTIEHELGDKKFALLRDKVEADLKVLGAAQLGTAGAVDRRVDDDHGAA